MSCCLERVICLSCSNGCTHYSINIWAGTVDVYIMRLYAIWDRLSGSHYADFLEEVLLLLLENVPLHSASRVHNWLSNNFLDRWIRHEGPTASVPHSAKLVPTPCIFICGNA
jgi:hypothetical protein